MTKKIVHYSVFIILLYFLQLNCGSIRIRKEATSDSSVNPSADASGEIKTKPKENPYLLKETPHTIRNGVHSASLLSNGRFSLGTELGAEKLDLIYGHPNNSYSDGIWSSYTSINVEGNTFKFDELLDRKFDKMESELTLTGQVPGYPVKISLTLLPFDRYGFKLRILAKNSGNTELIVGFRLLLDTWAGRSDGVPFILPGLSQGIESIYTHEVKFTPASSPSWETFDPAEPRTGFLRTSLVGDSLSPPNRVALVNWGLAFISDWAYEVEAENPVSGDSAVLSWWDPALVPVSGTREGSLLFESKERKDGIYFVPENTKGNGFLYLARENTSRTLQKRKYKISVQNGTYFSTWPSGHMEYEVPAGSYLYRMIPVTVSGRGSTKLQIEETVDGQTEAHLFSIQLESEIASTPAVWESGKKFPFRYVSELSGRKLKGRILDSSQTKRAEIPLVETKQDGYSLYEGEVNIDFEGEIVSEIVEED